MSGVIAKLLVRNYCFVHGTLKLPGAGLLLRRCLPFVRGLWDYPLHIPEVGTARLDFRDDGAFGMLNVVLGDYGHNTHLFRCFDRLVKPNQVLWDIGANIGYFSLYFALQPRQLQRLHSFEPNPAALTTLQSLFQNHPWVTVHPVGLGMTDQELTMSVPPGATPCGSLVRELPNGRKVLIQVRHGDRYAREQKIDLPDLIKIDVEGYELEVLAGLSGIIAAKRPVIIFEHGLLSDNQFSQIQHKVPPDYLLNLLSDVGVPVADLTRRNVGNDAILVPKEKRAILEKLAA
ncbi:MAG: FkbM family methyltransferase [Verrucomicrobiota bacterium]